jgi:hypothetical protein
MIGGRCPPSCIHRKDEPVPIFGHDHDANTEISRDEALAIRESVRLKLLHDYHSHLQIAHYYQLVGNSPRAKLERAAALEIKMILHHIKHEDEPPRGLSVRLTEEGAIE